MAASFPGLELLATAVLVLDAQQIVRYANPAAENLLGASAKSLVGQPFAQLFAPDPALEKALSGLEANDTKKVTLSPAQGFGEVDPTRMKEVAIEEIPEAARKVDASLVGVDAEGNQIPVRVAKIAEKTATLDLNHPLAGRTVIFDVKVLKIE